MWIVIASLLALLICCMLFIASRMDVSARQAQIINQLRRHVSPAVYQRVCEEAEK